MAGRTHILPAARTGLRAIRDYIAEDNPLRARTFLREVLQRCLDMPDMPYVGRARSELAPGLRSLPHGNYLVFYQIAGDRIDIVRVLRSSRHLPSQFE